MFLDALGAPPAGFVITLPKVSAVEQVEAMVVLCGRLETAHGLAAGSLRFELQIETPPAVLGADGAATVARLVHAAAGRCVGLHYGTYDYSAAVGIAAAVPEHGAPGGRLRQGGHAGGGGRHRRAAVGRLDQHPAGRLHRWTVRAAWELHARLVRRSLERGFYQGWDLHPAQLPTRFAATYAFFRGAAPAVVSRLRHYLARQSGGVLDEPATARALARFLLRGLDCGALDPSEVGFDRVDPGGTVTRSTWWSGRAGSCCRTASGRPRSASSTAGSPRCSTTTPASATGRSRTSATWRCCPASSTPTCT